MGRHKPVPVVNIHLSAEKAEPWFPSAALPIALSGTFRLLAASCPQILLCEKNLHLARPGFHDGNDACCADVPDLFHLVLNASEKVSTSAERVHRCM
jgi:hypothetical protein